MVKQSLRFISSFSISMFVALISLTLIPFIYGFDSSQKANINPSPNEEISFYYEFDQPTVLAHQKNKVIVRVGTSALEPPETNERLPLNLAIVLDKSGSMGSQHKIENARQGAIEMISHLNENDIVSLVVFDTQPRVLIPARHLSNKDEFIDAIQAIRAGGSTALYGGVRRGAAELIKNASTEYLNRIVLLSDGLANVGPQSNAEIFQLGESIIGDGMHVSAIGLGLSFNEELLEGLTVNSGGNYYYTNNSDELPEIFNREINKSITMLAQNIKIRLFAENGTRTLGVIGPANIEQSYMVETWIPFLYGGENKYRLIEINVPSGYDGQEQQIGRVEIEYFDPFEQQTKFHQISLSLDYSSNKQLVKRRRNKEVIKDAYLRRAAEYKDQAVEYARLGKYQNASRILLNTSNELEKAAIICDNDEDLWNASKNSRSLSTDVWNNQGYTQDIMKSEILNINMEFWGN